MTGLLANPWFQKLSAVLLIVGGLLWSRVYDTWNSIPSREWQSAVSEQSRRIDGLSAQLDQMNRHLVEISTEFKYFSAGRKEIKDDLIELRRDIKKR